MGRGEPRPVEDAGRLRGREFICLEQRDSFLEVGTLPGCWDFIWVCEEKIPDQKAWKNSYRDRVLFSENIHAKDSFISILLGFFKGMSFFPL